MSLIKQYALVQFPDGKRTLTQTKIWGVILSQLPSTFYHSEPINLPRSDSSHSFQ